MKKLKSTLIVWIAIYPAITTMQWIFGEFLSRLPILVRTLLLTVVLVPMMTYVLIPFWSRLFTFKTTKHHENTIK